MPRPKGRKRLKLEENDLVFSEEKKIFDPVTRRTVPLSSYWINKIYNSVIEEERQRERANRGTQWLLEINNDIFKLRWSGLGTYDFDFIQSGFSLTLPRQLRPSSSRIIQIVKDKLDSMKIGRAHV